MTVALRIRAYDGTVIARPNVVHNIRMISENILPVLDA
jgi:hypothetical protein